jgi:glutamine synthetase
MQTTGFIEAHGLWSDEQSRLARELAARLPSEGLRLVRLAWSDSHGYSRAKALTVPAFLEALRTGYNINVATTTLDSANARVFSSFTRGGGMGVEEMTGSPNLVIVPDPKTFRILPWAPGIGWVLCDEYFPSGAPFPFSTRQLLRRQLEALQARGQDLIVGLEVEWYLTRLDESTLDDAQVALPGVKGRPPRTRAVEPGYSYHSESNLDLMQPVLSELVDTYQRLGLPLRSVENEWGPGQVECTFSARPALAAADDMVLFRTATRQVCRRLGYLASFMCRPALRGFFSSGWHLHQSLIDLPSGRNLFAAEPGTPPGAALSALGTAYLGGLLGHAAAATVFTTPTVNGYRRFRPNSLAPDRAGWGYDNRGAMIRVVGRGGDPATRLENRVGEPAANPYLYFASQVICGLDGIDRGADPGPPDDAPYAAPRPALPRDLGEALQLLERDTLMREAMGGTFIDYYLQLKRSEYGRFQRHIQDEQIAPDAEEITAWEQNEYFDFF